MFPVRRISSSFHSPISAAKAEPERRIYKDAVIKAELRDIETADRRRTR